MDKVRLSLINGIQSTLWDKQLDDNLFLSLSESDWNTFYDLASRNTIEGLLFDVLEKLPDNTQIPKSLISKWCVRIEQIKDRNLRTNSNIADQLSVFAKANIQPVLQKGQGIAQFYPNPQHRNCGDIDWYFDNKPDFEKACEIGKEKGENFSRSIKDAFFLWNGLETEYHTRLVETRNPLKWKYIKSLEKKYESQQEFMYLQNMRVKLPAPLLNIVLVHIHILKHQITYGIGMRQLCDAAVLLKTFHNKYDSQELHRVYKTLGVLPWVHVFHGLLVKYIGLNEDYLPFKIKLSSNKDIDWMLNDILRGGNFGFNHMDYDDYSSKSGRVNKTERLSKSFIKYVQLAPFETLVFPAFQVFNKLFKNIYK